MAERRQSERIRVGNQTSRSARQMFEPFDYALACGFDAFEWFADRRDGWGFDYSQVDQRACQRLAETGKTEGIRYSIHPPVTVRAVAPEGQTILKTSLDFARSIGAKVVVVHMDEQAPARAFAAAIKSILARGRGGSVKLAVENVPTTGPEVFNELFDVLKTMSCRDRVGMCFDLGHANLYRQTRNDYLSYIAKLGDHVPVIHSHVHENRGDGDTHLPLFTGPAGEDSTGVQAWTQWLVKRGFEGSMIMEVWPQPAALLCETRSRLKRLVSQK